MHKKLKPFLLINTFLILFLFWLGVIFDLFIKINNYDTFLHLLGGFWGACIIIWLYKKFPKKTPFHKKVFSNPFIFVPLLMLLVGLGWELFEFILVEYSIKAHGTSINLQPSNLDTLTDLISDFVGAFVAVFILDKKDSL
ncbi:MAG: hypothetical protein WD607_08730 [Candidatus Paceibacterota bacterium]